MKAYHKALPPGTTLFLLLAVLSLAAAPAALGQMVTLSTDVILGFENVAGWRVKVNSAASPSVALRTARTQGSWAYSLTNPAIETELRSLALSSTSPLLAGIGVPGASFAVDIRLPSGTSSLSPGSLRLAVNSASRD
jgi:hypothetical protein